MKYFAILSLVFITSVVSAQNNSDIYDFPDVEAEFPGGAANMQEFIIQNIQYPEEAINKNITGRVYVSFVVRANGDITDIKIERGVHPSLDAESVRVVSAMPKWIPGEAEGKKVATRCRLPIVYTLTDSGKPDKKRRLFKRR